MSVATPAIVSSQAAQRLPRLLLLLLCVGYVLPGLFGRDPWKAADITAFGHMLALSQGGADWWAPAITGHPADASSPLTYWLGAGAIRLWEAWLPADLAVRLPFAGLVASTLAATWYAAYHFSRMPAAQPVAFAFGGEASPGDYARAVADGALLALIACLGLAQLSHETTPAVVQLAALSWSLLGMAAVRRRPLLGGLALFMGLAGLSLGGAPTLALCVGLLAWLVQGLLPWLKRQPVGDQASGFADNTQPASRYALSLPMGTISLALLVAVAAAAAGPGWTLQMDVPATAQQWSSMARLFLWFGWPAWPLAAWTLWRWRGRLAHTHLLIPLAVVALTAAATIVTRGADRTLLVGLPALAVLAAFALPTLQRSVGALVDWFTLLFFTGCAALIWLFWLAMQTGYPAPAAASIKRLYGGFEPTFQALPFVIALLATIAWVALVAWRVGRHRHPIWKSLALPAGGAALSWLLLSTLWMPLLNHVRSYTVMAKEVAQVVGQGTCVLSNQLNPAQVVALQYHAQLQVRAASSGDENCEWMAVDADRLAQHSMGRGPEGSFTDWRWQGLIKSSTGRDDELALYRRVQP